MCESHLEKVVLVFFMVAAPRLVVMTPFLCCPSADATRTCYTWPIAVAPSSCHQLSSIGTTRTCYSTLNLHALLCCHHVALQGTLAVATMCWCCEDLLCPFGMPLHHPNSIIAATLPCQVGTLVAISHGRCHHRSALCWGAPLMLHLRLALCSQLCFPISSLGAPWLPQ